MNKGMIVRRPVTLNRYEGKQAVFLTESGQEFAVPKDELGRSYAEGSLFSLQLLPEEEAALERQELARTLLNQLLNEESTSPSQGTAA